MPYDVIDHPEKKDSTEGEFIRFIIPGVPIPLQRHRHGNGHTYDPQKMEKQRLRSQFQLYHRHVIPLDGPLSLEVVFHMPIPKSISPVRAKLKDNTPHFIKPDTSNLIKFVEDTFSELLYPDDAAIATIVASKIYSTRPRTEVLVRKISPCKK